MYTRKHLLSHGLDDELFHFQSELQSTNAWLRIPESLFALLRDSVGACMMFRMRCCQGG